MEKTLLRDNNDFVREVRKLLDSQLNRQGIDIERISGRDIPASVERKVQELQEISRGVVDK